MVVKWTFSDPVTLDEVTWEVNPREGGTPSYQKNITYKNTSAPDGKVVVFQGRNNPTPIEFSGVILNQAQYDMFVTWWEKDYQVDITDDLGREFSILIESFVPKRERARSHPWKHTYTVTATIVDWA